MNKIVVDLETQHFFQVLLLALWYILSHNISSLGFRVIADASEHVVCHCIYMYVYRLCAEQGKKVVLLVLALGKINDKTSLQYMN